MSRSGFVVKVPAEGAIVKAPFDKEHSYKQLSDAVGGYIECAVIPRVGHSGPYEVDCFVNEEGLLKHLPFNPRLTAFASSVYDGPLVGDGIFVGHDGEGETVGLEERDADELVKMLESIPEDSLPY